MRLLVSVFLATAFRESRRPSVTNGITIPATAIAVKPAMKPQYTFTCGR